MYHSSCCRDIRPYIRPAPRPFRIRHDGPAVASVRVPFRRRGVPLCSRPNSASLPRARTDDAMHRPVQQSDDFLGYFVIADRGIKVREVIDIVRISKQVVVQAPRGHCAEPTVIGALTGRVPSHRFGDPERWKCQPITRPPSDWTARAPRSTRPAAPPAEAAVQAGTLELRLRYNSRIDRARSRLTLIRADDGRDNVAIAPDGPPDIITARLDLTPGAYVIRWQVLAVDGHITRGDVPFTVTAP